MILAGGKCGHPWHGLWRSADNKILTPSGVLIDCPGQAPSHELQFNAWHWPPGDAYAVRVPGQPAVTNSTEDDTAGRHWLNYGVISGIKHRFYGKNLEPYAWLYVAPDKSVWLAQMTYTIATGGVTVTLSRWGDFRPGKSANTVILTGSHAPITATRWMIDDINSDGSQVLVTLFVPSPVGGWSAQPGLHGVRWCRGGIRITISGNPPSGASLTVTVMVGAGQHVGTQSPAGSTLGDYAGHWTACWINPATGQPENTYTGGTVSWTGSAGDTPAYAGPTGIGWNPELRRFFITYRRKTAWARGSMTGLAFDAAGAAQVVIIEIDTEITETSTWSTSIVDNVYRYSGTVSQATTSQARLKIGASSSQITSTSTYTLATAVRRVDNDYVLSGTDARTLNMTVGGYTFSGSSGVNGVGGEMGFPGGDPVVEVTTGRDYLVSLYAVRYGNGLYGFMQTEQPSSGGSTFDAVRYCAIVSPTGADTGIVTVSAPAGHFASRNPGTGQISRSNSPICWV